MPSGFSVIVLPTDLGEPPGEAFALARSLAGLGARLIVVHIDGPADRPSAAPCRTRQAAILDPPGSCRVEHTTRHGPAADSIVGLAEEVGCELIVIGTLENDGFGRLANEIAQDVLRRAACPVLCLPASGREIRPSLDAHAV